MINFGIAHYFQEISRKEKINALVFSLLIDESVNHILQNEQLNIHIRFWDDSKCMAMTRYFYSHFLRPPNADNIVTKLQQSLQKLVAEKIIPFSMDGPATNWSVFEKISDQRKNDEIPCLENIGSCGLQIISNALQNGAKKRLEIRRSVKINVEIVSGPARRDIYMSRKMKVLFSQLVG